MGRNRDVVEPVGAMTVGCDCAEVVLKTDQGDIRVIQTWEGWERTVLLLVALKLELLGITVQSLMTGQVVAYESQPRSILSLPEGKVK